MIEDHILPSVYYQPLIHLLVESVVAPAEVRPPCTFKPPPPLLLHVIVSRSEQAEDTTALTMLEEVTTVESRQDVAMTLVKIYLGQGLVVPFLDYLNTREVQHTSKNEPMRTCLMKFNTSLMSRRISLRTGVTLREYNVKVRRCLKIWYRSRLRVNQLQTLCTCQLRLCNKVREI